MQRRHSLRTLLARGVAWAVGGVGVGLGVYPVAAHASVALLRLAKRRKQPAGFVRTLASEWALSWAMHAARPVCLLGLPVVGRAQGPRPVILLHGFLQGRANFLLLAHRLSRAGIGPLLDFEYWSLGRLERAADELSRFIDEVRARTGADKVDLVGHSMGGLVARVVAARSPWVANLVTLGTPHGGTDVARFGFGWPARELRYASEVIRALAPVPPGVKVTAIWSRADGLVPSSRYARLPGAEELRFDDLGHLSLLVSRRVAAAIAERLLRAS